MSEPDLIVNVFSATLGVPATNINDDTSPDNTRQWDSLQAMNLVVALEEAFQVQFSTKEIMSMRTVGLARKVLRQKGVA